MKVKAVEIARALGLSKATVSLALNGKPGVKEETKERVYAYLREQEEKAKRPPEKAERRADKVKILVLNRNRKVVGDPQLDLMSVCIRAMDQEIKRHGYSSETMFYHVGEDDGERILEDCNRDYVCGVILFATEMDAIDAAFCAAIEKPLVVYDYDGRSGKYHTVCIDNQLAVRMAVDELLAEGAETIRYIEKTSDIFNYRDRRRGFARALAGRDMVFHKSDRIPMGDEISVIERRAEAYLKEQYRPEIGYLAENYQIAVGMLRAAGRLHIEGMKIVGIDEIPPALTEEKIPQVRLPHVGRARIAAKLLMELIGGGVEETLRVKCCPQLLYGKHDLNKK